MLKIMLFSLVFYPLIAFSVDDMVRLDEVENKNQLYKNIKKGKIDKFIFNPGGESFLNENKCGFSCPLCSFSMVYKEINNSKLRAILAHFGNQHKGSIKCLEYDSNDYPLFKILIDRNYDIDLSEKSLAKRIKKGEIKRFLYNHTSRDFRQGGYFYCPLCEFHFVLNKGDNKYDLAKILEHFVNSHNLKIKPIKVGPSALYLFEIIIP